MRGDGVVSVFRGKPAQAQPAVGPAGAWRAPGRCQPSPPCRRPPPRQVAAEALRVCEQMVRVIRPDVGAPIPASMQASGPRLCGRLQRPRLLASDRLQRGSARPAPVCRTCSCMAVTPALLSCIPSCRGWCARCTMSSWRASAHRWGRAGGWRGQGVAVVVHVTALHAWRCFSLFTILPVPSGFKPHVETKPFAGPRPSGPGARHPLTAACIDY